MKKIKFVLLVICLLALNVKADMGPPFVVSYKAMITNPNGAECYTYDGKKEGKIIPYKTVFEIDNEMSNGLISVYNDNYSCYVKYQDLGAMSSSFDINNQSVEKKEPTRAIILAKGGLNMRKGPATSYGKVITIPENTVVTLTHKAGTYWFYTSYGGKSGWITGMNGYFGIDEPKILFSNKAIDIYNSSKKKIGTIPANTEITDYVKLITYYDDYRYYVVYNNIKGYILDEPYYKVETTGKIRLLRDYDIKDSNGNPIRKLVKGKELDYDYLGYDYFGDVVLVKEKNNYIAIAKSEMISENMVDNFEYLADDKIKDKERGYIGEGIFGEEIIAKTEELKKEVQEEPVIENEHQFSNKEIIIIALLSGILIALVILVIIKLVNKKNKYVVIPSKEFSEKEPEIDSNLKKRDVLETSTEKDENNN